MKNVCVYGAGTMGSGISYVCAEKGYEAFVYDMSEAVLEKAKAYHNKLLNRAVEKGKMTQDEAEAVKKRLHYVRSDDEALRNASFVVEAVYEDVELKKEVFKRIEETAPEDAVLGTNTSSISVTKIAGAVSTPERVVGIHFFNPVPVMKLVEVVRGLKTSEDTLKRAVEFAESLGKTVVVVNDSPGFVTTRIGLVMIAEAVRVLEAGVASKEDIDTAMKLGYNLPMGPLELADLIGLDVVLGVLDAIYQELGDPRYAAPFMLRKMVSAGKLGRKSGEGFFKY